MLDVVAARESHRSHPRDLGSERTSRLAARADSWLCACDSCMASRGDVLASSWARRKKWKRTWTGWFIERIWPQRKFLLFGWPLGSNIDVTCSLYAHLLLNSPNLVPQLPVPLSAPFLHCSVLGVVTTHRLLSRRRTVDRHALPCGSGESKWTPSQCRTGSSLSSVSTRE